MYQPAGGVGDPWTEAPATAWVGAATEAGVEAAAGVCVAAGPAHGSGTCETAGSLDQAGTTDEEAAGTAGSGSFPELTGGRGSSGGRSLILG